MGQRPGGNDRSAGMDAQVARGIVQPLGHVQNRGPRLVVHRQAAALRQCADRRADFAHRAVRQPPGEVVHLAGRHAKDFGDLADGQASVHGDEAANHGHAGALPAPGRHMLGSPVLVDVAEQLVAARAADINVNVRAIAALLVEEAFEVQPPAQRANAGNPQAVGHDGARRRAARHRRNAAPPRLLHNVPHQQEIGRQVQLFDHFQLVRQPRQHLGPQKPIPLPRAFEAQLPQIGKRRLARGHGKFREEQLAQLELQVAALGDFPRCQQSFRVIGEQALHLRCGLEPGFAAGDVRRRNRGQHPARADGVHRAVVQVLPGEQEVHVVRGRERHAQRAPQLFGFAQRAPIPRREQLHLQVQRVAEDLLQPGVVAGDA